ncbi:MAG: RNA 2',3'-cyclic phosphodiesterase [Candidatus Babeliales bacterium]
MKKRLFLAINFDDQILKKLAEYKKLVKFANVNWTKKENLHITVYFIGNLKTLLIPDLIENLNQVFSKTENFILEFDKILFAPPNHTAHMIWAQFKFNKNYEKLVQNVSKEINQNFNLQQNNNFKDFIPHITLARFKKVICTENIRLNQLKISNLLIDSCDLMESELNSTGPVYSKIITFKFGEKLESKYEKI